MCTDNHAVGHHVCIVAIGSHMPANPFSNAAFVPITQQSVDVLYGANPNKTVAARGMAEKRLVGHLS
jgi:hypothetical protein